MDVLYIWWIVNLSARLVFGPNITKDTSKHVEHVKKTISLFQLVIPIILGTGFANSVDWQYCLFFNVVFFHLEANNLLSNFRTFRHVAQRVGKQQNWPSHCLPNQ